MEEADPVCRDPGRALFYEHVGRYFSAPIDPKRKAPAGAVCSICGAKDVDLWVASERKLCFVQSNLTRKRGKRTSASQPATPAFNSKGMSAFSAGTFAIAGPHRKLVVSTMLPDLPLPPDFELVFSEKGKIYEQIVRLIRTPPEPPYVVVNFGQRALINFQVVIDNSLLIFSGDEPVEVPRDYMIWCLDLASLVTKPKLLKLLDARRIMSVRDVSGPARQGEMLTEIQTILAASNLSLSEFRKLPAPPSPIATVIRQLLR